MTVQHDDAAMAVTYALDITARGGLTDLIGPLKAAQDALYQRLLRIEELEAHLRNVLKVCAAEGISGRGALDDAADAIG